MVATEYGLDPTTAVVVVTIKFVRFRVGATGISGFTAHINIVQ